MTPSQSESTTFQLIAQSQPTAPPQTPQRRWGN